MSIAVDLYNVTVDSRVALNKTYLDILTDDCEMSLYIPWLSVSR